MNKQLVNQITATQIRPDLPEFSTGDTVRVSVKIRENNKERQQIFEGVVISIRGAGVSKTFTVRKDSAGVGVERVFLFNSPEIVFVDVTKHGKVRRKKLHYLRKRKGKAARLKEILLTEEQRRALEAKNAEVEASVVEESEVKEEIVASTDEAVSSTEESK